MLINTTRTRSHLQAGDLKTLFIEELGWDRLKTSLTVTVGGEAFTLSPVAEKRGVQIFQCSPRADGTIPEYAVRRKIEAEVTKSAFQHVVVFTDAKTTTQVWQWAAREVGKPLAYREQPYHVGQSGDALLQKLERIAFPLSEEEGLTLSGVTFRLKDAFDKEGVTKRFYDRFKAEHRAFLGFINNIPDEGLQQWYASVMINRLMFIYFIQAKGLLDKDPQYLTHKLAQSHGSFYRDFLCPLFFEGFAKRDTERSAAMNKVFGRVPYLNGGLFAKHQIEERFGAAISIPDKAFERLFTFFDSYNWHLDDRPLREGNEINPDVLGYIFEKYNNEQAKMGAYYTQEDITGYISRNTIIPHLLSTVRRDCRIAFESDGYIWRLLREHPDKYIFPALKKGTDHDLPAEITVGLNDLGSREGWSAAAPEPYGLPTEVWREVVVRRRRYEELRKHVASGGIKSFDDLITHNLDIRQFAEDVIASAEGPDLVRAFWKAIRTIRILDPTVGSGAFVFSALNILKPLYEACLVRMQGLVGDAERADPATSGNKFPDLRKELDRVDKHQNHDYFVLKSIIVNNLFGVDIMEEATEICKLRLFLKLVAQVERTEQLEPLPDIDFNIRAGNTLVGFANESEVQAAVHGDTQGKLGYDDAVFDRIRHKAGLVAQQYAQFSASQLSEDASSSEQAGLLKQEVLSPLNELRAELDHYMATQYDKDTAKGYAAWRGAHQPFHWFAEFFQVMGDGGFDVIIGNPPYVSVRKIEYTFPAMKGSKFSDIYAHVLTRTLALSSPDSRIGMIVPMSLTFSEDFGALRKSLSDAGAAWFSSYDILPSPLFNGVAQRCTIWIGGKESKPSANVSRLYRWRSVYRPNLFSNLQYTPVDLSDSETFGIPKHGTETSAAVLRAIRAAATKLPVRVDPKNKSNKSEVRYAKAALNFVSVFLESPPCMNSTTMKPIVSERIGSLSLLNQEVASAALAVLLGEGYMWYWLTRGDGFDVTGWVVSNFLLALNALPSKHFSLLSRIGTVMHERRNEALVFKHHAGQYVGNYNYRGLFPLTRRADLIFFAGLGVERADALEILDYVQRMLSINVFAGEKGIPPTVKAMFPPQPVDEKQQRALFAEVDKVLRDHYGFTEAELGFLLNKDVKFGVVQNGGTAGDD